MTKLDREIKFTITEHKVYGLILRCPQLKIELVGEVLELLLEDLAQKVRDLLLTSKFLIEYRDSQSLGFIHLEDEDQDNWILDA